MPIKPENRNRYPANWKEIRASTLERANNRCEFCGKQNHTHFWNEKTGKMVEVVLTIAHLDHTPENCDPSNLRALCQKCHNRYDAKHRAETRARTRAEKCLVRFPIPDLFAEEYINNYPQTSITTKKKKNYELQKDQQRTARLYQDARNEVLR